jgi:diguanylate cyclase (GGDEF)-like protein
MWLVAVIVRRRAHGRSLWKMAEMRPLPEEAVPPSVLAARRSGVRTGGRDNSRAYPFPAASDDPKALGAELAATQALLRAESAAEVGGVVSTFVHDLGGGLIPARYADPATVIPLDVSLGLSEPLLPFADPVSVAAMRLRAVLPEFLEAARLVLSRLQGDLRRDEEASRDQLTGVLTRRAWMRRLSGAVPGDSVCLIDLDHFKTVNDTGGHAAGDAVLRAIGGLMLRTFRKDDSCGRYGGDELVCLTPRSPGPSLVARCEQVRQAWEQERPIAGAQVGLSIGVAEVDERGGLAALRSADSAMYQAKVEGRNRTVLASPDDSGRGDPA